MYHTVCTYLLSVELYCMNFGHLGDENFLKRRTRQEDILGSGPTAPAVRTLQFKPNLLNISILQSLTHHLCSLKRNLWESQISSDTNGAIWARSGQFFAGLALSSVIFCMECPYCQYFPAKVDFWNKWPPPHQRAASIPTFLRSSFQAAAPRYCTFTTENYSSHGTGTYILQFAISMIHLVHLDRLAQIICLVHLNHLIHLMHSMQIMSPVHIP